MRTSITIAAVLVLIGGIGLAASKPTPTPDVRARACAFEAAHPGVLRVGAGVPEPREISRVPPVYPEAARRKKRVLSPIVLEAVITDTGIVRDATILRSDHPDLDPAVIEAVRQWRYEPAKVNGKPVAVFLTVTVTF